MKPYQGQFEPAVFTDEPIPMGVQDLHVITRYRQQMIRSREEWLYMCQRILPLACVNVNIKLVEQLIKSRRNPNG